jgi:hypothetical protein
VVNCVCYDHTAIIGSFMIMTYSALRSNPNPKIF